MYHNLRTFWQRWGMISKLLTNMGLMVRALGILYKSVEQTVLLYERDNRVVTGAMLKVLEGFHHWEARWIAGMTDRRTEEIEWKYPPVVDVL